MDTFEPTTSESPAEQMSTVMHKLQAVLTAHELDLKSVVSDSEVFDSIVVQVYCRLYVSSMAHFGMVNAE